MTYVLIILAIAAYFLPTIFAFSLRHKANAPLITALNVFAGWTIVGWAVLLGWSLSKDK